MEGVLNNINHGLRSKNDQTPTGRSFFKSITSDFGYKTTKILKLWIKFRHQLAVSNARCEFLLRCRSSDFSPRHILNHLKHFDNFSFRSKFCKNLFHRFNAEQSRYLLKLEIKDIHIHKSYLYKSLNSLKRKIDNLKLDSITVTNFLHNTEEKSNKIFHNHSKKLNRKFESLAKNYTNSNSYNLNNDQWVKNLSEVHIPDNVLEVVSLGPNFNIKENFTKNDVVLTVKNVEHSLDKIDINQTVKNNIRETVTNALINNMKKVRHIPAQDREFAKKLSETNNFLKQNSNIFFTRADKGNLTVCMNTSDYRDKMNTLFKDKHTYKIVKRNPLKSLQSKVHKILSNLNDQEFLKKRYHNNNLTQTNTTLAKAYGLPKIHKVDVPLRPIISLVNSPTHFLAKTLYDELKNCIKPPNSRVHNSFEFKEKITKINVPPDFVLLSLDVSSLFTNIPCDLVLNSLDKRFTHIHNRSKIPFDEIIKITKFLFDNTYFTFDSNIYKQTFGTPMGSPISPLFADLVMEDLETYCLKKLKSIYNCEPLFYHRYVDDTILCIKKEHVNIVLKVFNEYNKNLKFTHEIEENNSINFLDTSIIKINNKLITNWYQKPTCSGRLLNFKSNHTMQQKRNIISNLIDRSILLSDKSFHIENINKVKTILLENDYPKKFIDSCINDRLRSIKFSTKKVNSNNKTPLCTLAIPFQDTFFNKITRSLKKLNIRLVPLINHNLTNIIKLGKDKTDIFDQTGVVYKFNCKDCSACYIGETKRKLKDRITEHKKTINKLLPVPLHIIENSTHEFDWNNVKILDREANYKKRLISEMLHINMYQHTLNRKEDTQSLSHTYRKLNNIFQNKPTNAADGI